MLFPTESDLIRRESALKGMGMLLDPDKLVASLRSFFPNNKPSRAQATYIRYKPRTSCIVSYNLEMDYGPNMEVYAKAITHSAIGKLKKASRESACSVSNEPRVIILEDEDVAIFTFPYDGKLGALPELVNEDSRLHLLRKLLPGCSDILETGLENIRYKPEQRFVGCLSIKGKHLAKIKVYAPAWYRAANLNAKVLCSRKALQIPGRIGRSTRHRILVFEWVNGILLRDLILGPSISKSTLKTVGAALAEMHAQKTKELRFITRDNEIASLLLTAAELGFIFPSLKKRVDHLARELSDILAHAPSIKGSVHGDFNSEQVIIEGDSAIMLDLDNAACADPSADLGLFLAQLVKDEIDGTLSRDRLELVKEAILEGYESTARYIPDNIELYTSVGLLRTAADLHKTLARFGRYQTDWPQLTESLLERACDILHKNKGAIQSPPEIALRKKTPVIDPFDLSKRADMLFLSGALNPAEVVKRFSEFLSDTPEAENGRFGLQAIRAKRYKPGRRCIIEYDFEQLGAASQTVTLLGKVRAKGLDKSAFSCACSLWENGFGFDCQDGIMIPDPIGVIPEYHMWLQRKVPGKASIHLLQGSDGIALAGRIVDAIHKLQQTNVTPTRKPHTIMDEVLILHTRLSEVARMRLELSCRIGRLLDACDRLCHNTAQCEPVCSHRDFYYEHVIVDGSRIYLLDFDLYCKADPGLDIGNFLGHLTEYALRILGDAEALIHIEKVIEKKFAELYDEKSCLSMHTYTLLTLVRHIYLSTLSGERCKFTEDLLELCEKRIADAVEHNGLLLSGRASWA